MKRSVVFMPFVLLAACSGESPMQSVAPTPETIAFLKLDAATLRGCVDVETIVVDGAAGLVTGSENGALAAAAKTGLDRCGEVSRVINVTGRSAAERPRVEACQRAFAAKTRAYTALNQTLAAEGDFMATQQGTRAFLAGIRESTPQMRVCNTPT